MQGKLGWGCDLEVGISKFNLIFFPNKFHLTKNIIFQQGDMLINSWLVLEPWCLSVRAFVLHAGVKTGSDMYSPTAMQVLGKV